MAIGDRRWSLKIREKQQARIEYQAAKSAGKTAALLEQHRPNVFQMNVANILPGDEIVVELRYTELLVPTDSIYEFVFPTVVGPRYISQAGRRRHRRRRSTGRRIPTCTPESNPRATFTCTRRSIPAFRSRMPRRSRTGCVSRTRAPGVRRSNCCAIPPTAANRDFILRYRLAGAGIESGLMLFEDAAKTSSSR